MQTSSKFTNIGESLSKTVVYLCSSQRYLTPNLSNHIPKMVKTYILAPNWSTAPPPAGPINLGHLLDNLKELVPINRADIVSIPLDLLNPVDIKSGFTTSRGRLLSGELGVFAKMVGLVGVGTAAEIYYTKEQQDVLSCETLDTITFDPSPSYIYESMERPEVQKFMQGAKFKAPVFMITGLKVGKGASLQSTGFKEKGLKMDGGLNPPEIPTQFGVKAGLGVKVTEGESWEGSTDFIVAFRVKKIWYKGGDVQNQSHNKNAVMQDGTKKGVERALVESDNIGLEDFFTHVSLRVHTDVENGEEVNWIIPDVRLESTEEPKGREG